MRLYARPIDSYDTLDLIEVVAKLPSEIINSHKSKPKIHFSTLLLFLFFQSDERALSLELLGDLKPDTMRLTLMYNKHFPY